jgi:copper homeostasis protein
VIVEICVGDVASALEAERAGADRVELCADLAQGGTTPSIGSVAVALETLRHTALRVMIRPRGGDFSFSGDEERVMLADIEALRALPNPNNLHLGVVLGAVDLGGCLAVLTSGRAPTAVEGAGRIAELRTRAAGRLLVMAGGGVRSHNVREVLALTGVDAVHMRANDPDQIRRTQAEIQGYLATSC